MLKALVALTAVAGLVFFLSLAGLAYYSSYSEADKQQPSAQAEGKNQTEKDHSLRRFVRFLFPDAISIFTLWLVVATAAPGVIAGIQIYFLQRAEVVATASANAAKDSAETARASLIATQRPFVAVDLFETYVIGNEVQFM